MYGTPTCGDCVLAKQVFAEKNIDYDYIDISNDEEATKKAIELNNGCLLYTSPSPRDPKTSRMPSSA